MITLPEQGAIFNEDRTRRYWLGRRVVDPNEIGDGVGRLLVIACNPSTADETANDPTIRKEIKFAHRWGFKWLDKVNLFDWRATKPSELKRVDLPRSHENDRYVFAAAERATMILCAWGANGSLFASGARMKRLLCDLGYRLYVLKLNTDGSPVHPLYQPDSSNPIAWDDALRIRAAGEAGGE